MRETRNSEYTKTGEFFKMTEKISDDDAGNAPGPAGSGEPGVGEKRTDTAGTRTGAGKRSALNYAGRMTALRGPGIGRPREQKSSLMRQTRREIHGRDPGIPYVKFETIVRDPACFLMERQGAGGGS